MDKINLISLFENMLYIRLVEEKICEEYPKQEMRCPVHISIGQEAIAVGVCDAIKKEDLMFSNHRSHAHYLAKGGNLNKFIAELYGKITGCSKGKGGSMHLIDLNVNFMGSTSIVGGTISLAVGAAFTQFMTDSDNMVVTFLGDAASEEGVFYESINFAKLKELPIIFICENNLYSVYSSLLERQPKRKIIDIVKAHGIISYEVEGNNPIAVSEIVQKAIKDIKTKSGPIFIEASTYRLKEHCGPNNDNHLGYRTEEEFLNWKNKDPLVFLKEKLIREELLTPEKIIELETKINQQILEAFEFAKTSDFPNFVELDKDVYAD